MSERGAGIEGSSGRGRGAGWANDETTIVPAPVAERTVAEIVAKTIQRHFVRRSPL
jgi:hypothetical protein